MKNNELRGIVLNKFYELRRMGPFEWTQFNDADCAAHESFFVTVGPHLLDISDQLGQLGLVDWRPVRGQSGALDGGCGQISAFGIDVVEGVAQTPANVYFDQRISVISSPNAQIGNSNVQSGDIHGTRFVSAINSPRASFSDQAESKSLVGRIFNSLFRKFFGKWIED